MSEYQPIAVKHEEQEKAVTAFMKNAQVHCPVNFIFLLCLANSLYMFMQLCRPVCVEYEVLPPQMLHVYSSCWFVFADTNTH